MTTYDPIAAAQYAHKAPVNVTLAQSWSLNPTAIAEGSTDAPVSAVGWHPYDMAAVGDGATGEVWSFATDGAVSTIETPDFADGYEYRLRLAGLEVSVNGNALLDCYRVTDATWRNIATTAITTTASLYGLIGGEKGGFDRREKNDVYAASQVYDQNTVFSFEGTSTRASVDVLQKLRLTTSAGNFDAGAVYLERRRDYTTG